MSDHQVDTVAEAAMGVTMFMMGHSHTGKWGMIKEAFAMRKGVGDVPSGPGHDLIEAAKDQLAGDGDSGPNIDATDKDRMLSQGRANVEAVVPVLHELADDAAEQVRGWLMGVAQHVAGAAKDKGGHGKVSAEEEAAMDELRALLHG